MRRLWYLLLLGLGCLTSPAMAQQPLVPVFKSFAAATPSKQDRHKSAEAPAIQPDAVIPVTPLGFTPPAPYYLGDRMIQVSLDFLDEDTLLFTFRVPGLIPRDPPASYASDDSSQVTRNIRALMIAVPSGRITAEALWRLHDYLRYVWVLKDKKFLLRDRNTVQVGDATLKLTPFLRFPGPVSYLEFDPEQRWLVANTSELIAPNPKTVSTPGSEPNPNPDPRPNPSVNPKPEPQTSPAPDSENSIPQPSPSTSPNTGVAVSGHLSLDSPKPAPSTQNLLRILRMDTLSVILYTPVAGVAHIALDEDGYYEALRGKGTNWTIAYDDLQGASIPIVQIESTCYPNLDVEAPGILLASACNSLGGRTLTAVARQRAAETGDRAGERNKSRLWDTAIPATSVWPLIVHSEDGTRIARATLEVTHPVNPTSPLDTTDIRSQNVQVYDLATGKVELSLRLSPVLDAGGNFALSPSGKRFAVLNAGAIQVYELAPVSEIPPANAANPPSAKP